MLNRWVAAWDWAFNSHWLTIDADLEVLQTWVFALEKSPTFGTFFEVVPMPSPRAICTLAMLILVIRLSRVLLSSIHKNKRTFFQVMSIKTPSNWVLSQCHWSIAQAWRVLDRLPIRKLPILSVRGLPNQDIFGNMTLFVLVKNTFIKFRRRGKRTVIFSKNVQSQVPY